MPTTEQEEQPPANCPQCGAEIDHLNFRESITSWGTEGGTCDLDGGNYHYEYDENHDTQVDEVIFSCPECEAEIGKIEDWPEQTEQRDEEEPEPVPQDMENHPTGELVQLNTRMKKVRIYQCPECRTKRELDMEEDYVICDQCSYEHEVNTENTEIY